MDVLLVVFVVNTAFAAWVVFRGGAEWLRSSLPSGMFADRRGVPWSTGKLRAFVGGLWGANAWALWVLFEG